MRLIALTGGGHFIPTLPASVKAASCPNLTEEGLDVVNATGAEAISSLGRITSIGEIGRYFRSAISDAFDPAIFPGSQTAGRLSGLTDILSDPANIAAGSEREAANLLDGANETTAFGSLRIGVGISRFAGTAALGAGAIIQGLSSGIAYATAHNGDISGERCFLGPSMLF